MAGGAGWQGRLELFAAVGAVPFVLLAAGWPRTAGVAAAIVLLPIYAIRLARPVGGALTPWFIAYLVAVALPISLWTSPAMWEVSWPKSLVFLWSLAVFLVVVSWGSASDGSRDLRFKILTWAYLLFGALLTGLGVLGARTDRMRLVLEAFGQPELMQPNELAGTVVLFAPLALLMFLAPSTPAAVQTRVATRGLDENDRAPTVPIERIVLAALIAFFLITAALSGSRGAVVFMVLSIAIVLAVLGRIGRVILGIGFASALVGLMLLGPERAMELLLNTGSFQRLTIDQVLTRRPAIWESAAHAISDFPFTGMGIGVFGSVGQVVYPSSVAAPLEDAHNLYLQMALDLGVPGLIAFLGLVGSACAGLWMLWRQSPRGSTQRYVCLGLLASLAAHLLYSITDAVSLGTFGNVGLWFLLALVAVTHGVDRQVSWKPPSRTTSKTTRPPPSWVTSLKRRPVVALAVIGVTLAVIVWGTIGVGPSLARLARYNLATRSALRALFAKPEQADGARVQLSDRLSTYCRGNWFIGMQARRAGETGEMEAAWERAMTCSERFVALAHRTRPKDAALAERAFARRPDVAESHFWMASLRAADAPEDAIDLYRSGLDLDPYDGLRWRRLGDLLRSRDLDAAIEAFLQSCYNGDPGSNGCWRAGLAAEEKGDSVHAIEYFRRSRWERAHQRAAELEAALARGRFR